MSAAGPANVFLLPLLKAVLWKFASKTNLGAAWEVFIAPNSGGIVIYKRGEDGVSQRACKYPNCALLV
jgi:hypothetical protein